MAKSLKRNAPTQTIEKKILIACEGKKTEPKYFNAIRQDLRLPSEQVEVLSHEGTDPLGIVNAVVEARKKKKKEKTWEKEDLAWAVFDGDEHIANDPTNWHDAIQKAVSQKIHLAITNPNIEFWYLIHFRDHSASIERDKAKELLKQHIPNYDKAGCYYPYPLKPLTQDAIARAELLESLAKLDKLSKYSNPCCSGILQLVKLLLDLGNKNIEIEDIPKSEITFDQFRESVFLELWKGICCEYCAIDSEIWNNPKVLSLLFHVLFALLVPTNTDNQAKQTT